MSEPIVSAGVAAKPFIPALLFEAPDATVADALHARFEDLAQRDLFSGAVLMARGEEVLFGAAYGAASREYDVPNTLETRFNVASVAKMFTAVATARLVEQGWLAYDDPIGRFLGADWIRPQIGASVTVAQLLSHTGGVGDYFTPEFDRTSKTCYRALADFQPLVRNAEPTFAPGTRWDYSNTGFLLLGAIIEKAADAAYDDVVQALVFDPADMTSTANLDIETVNQGYAQGYAKVAAKPGEIDAFSTVETITERILRLADERNRVFEAGYTLRNNVLSHVVRGGPSGGGFSTAADMLKFLNALFHGRLVSADTLARMMSPKPASPDYGYGMMIADDGSFGHTGAFSGIETYVFGRPEDDRLIILSNLDNGRGNAFQALNAAAGLACLSRR